MQNIRFYLLEAQFNIRIHYSCEGRIKNPSTGTTVCHLSASLVMPSGDLRDITFYPTLTRILSYHCIYLNKLPEDPEYTKMQTHDEAT